MAKCASITARGGRCNANAMPGAEWCWSHDPANADKRKRNASKGGRAGGRGRPGVEVASIKKQLGELVEQVLDDSLSIPKAYAVNALLCTQLRAIEVERKVIETENQEARLQELERLAAEQNGGKKKWG